MWKAKSIHMRWIYLKHLKSGDFLTPSKSRVKISAALRALDRRVAHVTMVIRGLAALDASVKWQPSKGQPDGSGESPPSGAAPVGGSGPANTGR
jgi:hypothetical protein